MPKEKANEELTSFRITCKSFDRLSLVLVMNANEVILWPQWTIKKAKRTGSPFFLASLVSGLFFVHSTTKGICSSSIHNITNIAHKVLSILAYSTHTPYVWLKVMWLSSSWRLLWSVAFMHEIASSTKMFNTASKCYIFMILREMNKGFLNVDSAHYFPVKFITFFSSLW